MAYEGEEMTCRVFKVKERGGRRRAEHGDMKGKEEQGEERKINYEGETVGREIKT